MVRRRDRLGPFEMEASPVTPPKSSKSSRRSNEKKKTPSRQSTEEGCKKTIIDARSLQGKTPNTDVYHGEMVDGQRCGKGTLRDAQGYILYTGEWLTGKPHGYGTWYSRPVATDPSFSMSDYRGSRSRNKPGRQVNDTQRLRYEGNFIHGQREGMGVLLHPDGSRQVGQFKNGLMDGYGVYEWAYGDVYSGQWKNGMIHGEGKMEGIDGTCFKGHFNESRLEGYGSKTFANGDVYEGSFCDDLQHGFGEFRWLGGHSYCGEWDAGSFSGIGIHEILAHNSVSERKESIKCSGEFHNGCMRGFGKCVVSPGDSIYYGKIDEMKKVGSSISISRAVNPELSNEDTNKDTKEEETLPSDWLQKIVFPPSVTLTAPEWGRIEYTNGFVYEGECDARQRHGYGQLSFTRSFEASENEVLPSFNFDNLGVTHNFEELLQDYGGYMHGRFVHDMPTGVFVIRLQNNQVYEGFVVRTEMGDL